MTKFYTAGKIWHAPKFQQLRDELKAKVVARWIDLDDDHPIVQHHKDRLWEMCYNDVAKCDAVLIYAEEWEEEQRGALVEVGMAYGLGKPVFAINRCKSTSPNKISDVAFTHYKDWHWLNTDCLIEGWKMADKMFREAYKGKLTC